MKVSWLCRNLRDGLRIAASGRPSATPMSLRTSCVNPSTHQFSTTATRAGIAAPEIVWDVDPTRGVPQKQENGSGEEEAEDDKDKKFFARVVPLSRSYFGGQPVYLDTLISLRRLIRKYESLPVVKPGDAPRVAFHSLGEYKNISGELVKSSKYSRIMDALRRLNHIHPSVRPQEVTDALNLYKRDINPHDNKAKPIPIDRFGRALGVGRRKASTARAFLVEGTGEVMVNGKSLVDAFARVHDRESVIWALKATDRMDKYNIWALAAGGGTTGQAEALTLAVSKALIAHEPALKPALRRAGCVTRDPRRVERKKTGHVKARKMPAWVRR
ncbi:ribosomal protein S9/S16 [Phlyctema vagabunda]|uniref:Small ribosomal subunit protein uS9m n=1 Tax=Phlyctema vagabunda TaxID=108571 RepID=A0ABR4PQR4_9HELO